MDEPALGVPAAPPRQTLAQKVGNFILSLLVLAFLAFGAALWLIDTSPGRRFIAEQISMLRPESGLRIGVGRIDGSIWSRATLRDVRVSDPEGIFLEIPELRLDWRPLGWVINRLDIRSLDTDYAILARVPKFRSTGRRDKAILPGFDVRVDRLAIQRLKIEPAVAGRPENARVAGSADIRSGVVRLDLSAISTARDWLNLKVLAEPDGDDFDIDLNLAAPGGGVIGALFGTERPLMARIEGEGRWTSWAGSAWADVSGERIVALNLSAKSGEYNLAGRLRLASVTHGKLHRLSSPEILVKGSASLADRQLASRLSLSSGALTVETAGVVDLARSSFDDLKVDARLLRPPALFPNMTGRDVRLQAQFNGPFSRADFSYVLTSPRVAFDNNGFENVRATGKGRLSAAPVKVPVRLVAARVTGVGDVAGGILRNLSVDGAVEVTGDELRGTGLRLKSDKLSGKLGLLVDLVTGRFEVVLSGQLGRYLIPGLGIVDVTSDLKVVPGPDGRGTRVAGRGKAWVRRFDNAFLRDLAGGLPTIDTGLVRGPDGVLHFVDLKLEAPGIRLTGNGMRRRDGSFAFEGSGEQQQYGPLTLGLDGDISRPRLDIGLERPVEQLGLQMVNLLLDPIAQGYRWQASGGSYVGPFSGQGVIGMTPGEPTLIKVASLDVAGTRATGGVRSDPGGFTGKLVAAGGGIDGNLTFNPVRGMQRIGVNLGFRQASFGGPAALRVGRGRVAGTIFLNPAGLTVEGRATAMAISRKGVSLGRLVTDADLDAGRGRLLVRASSSRGRAFDLSTSVDIAPERIVVNGRGTIDRKPVALESPAVLTAVAEGWRLEETRLSFADGEATLAGLFSASGAQIDAGLQRLPLSILDVMAPELGFGGHASGRISYRIPRGSQLPVGDADLTIRGLTRSGLVLSSRPIDLGLKAKLTPNAAAARAVAYSEGRVIGAGQARVTPLRPDGTVIERLAQAPLFAQLRYNGPADTLWRLTGVESIDLSGPLAVAVDVGGEVRDPRIRGSLRATNARLESAVTGTLIEGVNASGRFGGSVLVLDSFSGNTRGGGTVTGEGRFDLAAVNGFGLDLSATATRARLLNRDDIAATVTGPIRIQSDGDGGLISGDVKVDEGRFRLGRASMTESRPLKVIEVNQVREEPARRARRPWALKVKAVANNRLAVTGLGLDSEWKASLDIGGLVTSPQINGRADLIRGGYEFSGRRFELDRGTVRFLGHVPPDPVLDIVATSSVQGLNATLQVSGTGQKPEIRFSSIPALPEDELLSRLLFGTSITNLSAPEALQLAAAVSSLQGGGEGLNPINELRRAAGLDRLRILPADAVTGQGASIAAGKYIGRRTYVELITDGQGYSATQVEFQITRWLSLLSTVSTIGRQSANIRVSKDY